jgi:hypothetical protein
VKRPCPCCGQNVVSFITNIRTGTVHCHGCIGPSFLPHFVLTAEDCHFLKACGIDSEVGNIERFIKSMVKPD